MMAERLKVRRAVMEGREDEHERRAERSITGREGKRGALREGDPGLEGDVKKEGLGRENFAKWGRTAVAGESNVALFLSPPSQVARAASSVCSRLALVSCDLRRASRHAASPLPRSRSPPARPADASPSPHIRFRFRQLDRRSASSHTLDKYDRRPRSSTRSPCRTRTSERTSRSRAGDVARPRPAGRGRGSAGTRRHRLVASCVEMVAMYQLAVPLAAALPRWGLGERALPRQIYLLPPCSRGARLASSLSYVRAPQARARHVELARPLSSCFSRLGRAQASTAHAPRARAQLALSLRLVGELRPRSASSSRRRHRANLLVAVVRSRPRGASLLTADGALPASRPRRTSYDRFSPVRQQVVDCLRPGTNVKEAKARACEQKRRSRAVAAEKNRSTASTRRARGGGV